MAYAFSRHRAPARFCEIWPKSMLKRVVNGAALLVRCRRLLKRPDTFSMEYVNVVRAGETIGDVGQSLGDLAEMLERRVELRSRISSALVYWLCCRADDCVHGDGLGDARAQHRANLRGQQPANARWPPVIIDTEDNERAITVALAALGA